METELLKLLKHLRKQKGTFVSKQGICRYLATYGNRAINKLFNDICEESKNYSGEYAYPIKGGQDYYHLRTTTPEEMWLHGDYAEARWEMVDFVIWYLETTWWKKVWYKLTGDMK